VSPYREPAPRPVRRAPRKPLDPYGMIPALAYGVGVLAVAVFALVGMLQCGAAAVQPTASDSALVAAETAEQTTCLELYKPDTAAIDLCRAGVKRKFDAYWSGHFDGGVR
jgi:hypothetical protein